MYSLERAQIINAGLDRAWDFLKNPANHALPFTIFGQLLHRLLISKMLAPIFNFRVIRICTPNLYSVELDKK